VYTIKRRNPCDRYKSVKHDLYLAGGHTSVRKTNNYNPTISKFDFESLKWENYKMEKKLQVLKPPMIIGCATVQVDDE
jgi:hypothetical protein